MPQPAFEVRTATEQLNLALLSKAAFSALCAWPFRAGAGRIRSCALSIASVARVLCMPLPVYVLAQECATHAASPMVFPLSRKAGGRPRSPYRPKGAMRVGPFEQANTSPACGIRGGAGGAARKCRFSLPLEIPSSDAAVRRSFERRTLVEKRQLAILATI